MNIQNLFYACCIILLSFACKSSEKAGKMDYENLDMRQANNQKTGTMDYGSPRVKQELVYDQMFLVKEYTTDKAYGYTVEKPIMVGGGSEGPKNERRFLNALTGPKGEQISYQRLGSCCSFYTKNGTFGDAGLLDKYEITYEGLGTPIILYINMYDSDILKVPVGFTLKK